jgi:hypothetical protein
MLLLTMVEMVLTIVNVIFSYCDGLRVWFRTLLMESSCQIQTTKEPSL